ncbi:hypothetical protein C1I64_04745 [Rathayibacter festucae DSM 15932]|uniref:DUF5681 domain-containing protein n=1 Tax=Rathayibacter festucae DSM 15932 TaxID=1328866 RepID=A0A3Q9UV84_9MICO|nr:hypothetical protein C1I64_04745 [Rathayibacter festucae DSM 15932]
MGAATQFKPGVSGNPAGRPKGSISLSQRIQQMLNDEDFEALLPDPERGFKEFRGAPAIAIIKAAIIRAATGDLKAADWLAKYGYGTKIDMDVDLKQAPVPLLVGLAPATLTVLDDDEDDPDGGNTPADDGPH